MISKSPSDHMSQPTARRRQPGRRKRRAACPTGRLAAASIWMIEVFSVWHQLLHPCHTVRLQHTAVQLSPEFRCRVPAAAAEHTPECQIIYTGSTHSRRQKNSL